MAQFVLVHGTTQSPAGWERLAGELIGRGHGVTAVDLAGDEPEWTVVDYARRAAAQASDVGERTAGELPDRQQQAPVVIHDTQSATSTSWRFNPRSPAPRRGLPSCRHSRETRTRERGK